MEKIYAFVHFHDDVLVPGWANKFLSIFLLFCDLVTEEKFTIVFHLLLLSRKVLLDESSHRLCLMSISKNEEKKEKKCLENKT